MKKSFSINDKKYIVTAWSLGAEKEALLSFGDGLANASLKNKIEVLSSILIPDIETEHFMDKFYLMVKMSAVINMDYKNISYICPNCETPCKNVIDISKNIIYDRPSEYKINFKNKEILLCNNIENISIKDTDTNDFLDSLTLSEYKDLESICRSAKFDLRLETDSLCVMCMKKTKVLRTIDDLLENYIISTDLDYYYKTLKYFSKKLGFSVSDFNNLYPFEIDILTREEEENNR